MRSFFKFLHVWLRSLQLWGGVSYLDLVRERLADERVRFYFEQLDQQAACSQEPASAKLFSLFDPDQPRDAVSRGPQFVAARPWYPASPSHIVASVGREIDFVDVVEGRLPRRRLESPVEDPYLVTWRLDFAEKA